MDIGAALASLIANNGSITSSLNNSIGFSIPDAVGISEADQDYISVQIGSIRFEAVPIIGITGKLSPLPDNLSGNTLIAYLGGNKEAPIALFISMPLYQTEPTPSGFVGTIIVEDLLHYNYGSGFIAVAPYAHKHFAGKGNQGQDSGGDFQQPVEVVLVEKTGWELGYG